MDHVSRQTCIKVTGECTLIAVTYFGRLCAIKHYLYMPCPVMPFPGPRGVDVPPLTIHVSNKG